MAKMRVVVTWHLDVDDEDEKYLSSCSIAQAEAFCAARITGEDSFPAGDGSHLVEFRLADDLNQAQFTRAEESLTNCKD